MPLYREQGVVLRTQKLGEADRIVTLLTLGRGIIRVVAKGVRRTSSKSTGSRMACGHSWAAFISPIAEPTPNCRAAEVAVVATPRPV